jgi:hypothetical protein
MRRTGQRSRRTAMSEQKAIFRSWGSEVLRQWRARRFAAASQAACSGYFHMGYVVDSFVFTPELPFKE